MESLEDAQKFIKTLERTIVNLKNTVSVLNEKLTNIEKENNFLREENMDLKSKIPNVGNLQKTNEMYKIEIDELKREIKVLKKNQAIFEAERSNIQDNKGDVNVLQKKISNLESQNKNLLNKIASINQAYAIDSKKPFVREIKEKEVEILENTSGGRRKCPNCNNKNPALIKEHVDKTNVIFNYPRMYGKKFKCGECGAEWR
ncbi:MAG: hypothetical protein ACFFAH_06945 [Promethearchaeota archaeon]